MTLVINPKIPTQSDRISISMTMAIVGFSVRDARDDAAYARDPESNREREKEREREGEREREKERERESERASERGVRREREAKTQLVVAASKARRQRD